jgi:hypothetical protein
MNFSLVFDTSGDTIPFKVIYNHELFEFFVDQANRNHQNSFSDQKSLSLSVDQKISSLHSSLTNVNQVLYELIGYNLPERNDLLEYLDQHLLNEIHAKWVKTQAKTIPVHQLRFSPRHLASQLGQTLHKQYSPDEQFAALAPVMQKLGLLIPYEEVNTGVHSLERSFDWINFDAPGKWQIFDNPYQQSMISNHDIVNFSFAYTYLGRQHYNKFENFDVDLAWDDHYNYEVLEYSFTLNLKKPQTIPFSFEFMDWCKQRNVQPIGNRIPIANMVDIDRSLLEYRKILYRNSKAVNQAKIIIG